MLDGDVAVSHALGMLMLGWVLAGAATLALRGHPRPGSVESGRFGWSVAVLCAVVFVGRGMYLGRPVTPRHAAVAAAAVSAGLGAHLLMLGMLGNVLIVSSGVALMLPTSARPQPERLQEVWALVNRTSGDSLAPFAMHSLKSCQFSAGRHAAIAYRTRLGFAVVSGDPIGDVHEFDSLVVDFVRMCRCRGWRIIVLACSQRTVALWRDELIGRPRMAVQIGRDVVIDVRRFSLTGRRYRNLRQAVRRTHNCGLTTEIVSEQHLDRALIDELNDVLRTAHRSGRTERGFCMNLDGTLVGRFPGVTLAIARDSGGRAVAFHRYATAGNGSEFTLDRPFRRPDAPNGVDERLTVDMIAEAKARNVTRLSLAFSAFPETFAASRRSPLQRVAYQAIHLLNPMIRLESLYRYLRKYHALAERRYVVLCARHVPAALLILLSLEFMPRPRSRRQSADNRIGIAGR